MICRRSLTTSWFFLLYAPAGHSCRFYPNCAFSFVIMTLENYNISISKLILFYSSPKRFFDYSNLASQASSNCHESSKRSATLQHHLSHVVDQITSAKSVSKMKSKHFIRWGLVLSWHSVIRHCIDEHRTRVTQFTVILLKSSSESFWILKFTQICAPSTNLRAENPPKRAPLAIPTQNPIVKPKISEGFD